MLGVAFSQFAVVIFIALGGQSSVPLGMPPGPEDPMMAQFAPAECLLYTTWSPTVAPDPTQSVTERWMAQPEIQSSFAELKNAMQQLSQQGNRDEMAFGQVAYRLAERCLSHSVGLYVTKLDAGGIVPVIEGGVLIDLGPNGRETMTQINQAMKRLALMESFKIDSLVVSGIKFSTVAADQFQIRNRLTWGFVKDKYLAITIGEGEMQRLLGNMSTDAPEWLVDLRQSLSVGRVSSVTRIDVEGCVESFRQFAATPDSGDDESLMRWLKTTGIAQLQMAGWVSGLDEKGFICRGSYRIQGEPDGLFGLIDAQPLEPRALGRISGEQTFMVGARISLPKVFQLVRDLNDLDPRTQGQFDRGLESLNKLMGIQIEEEVIGNLDNHAYLYGTIDPQAPLKSWVLGVGASSEMSLMESYNKFIDFLRTSNEIPGSLVLIETTESTGTVFTLKDTSEWRFFPDISWSLCQGELLISLHPSGISRHLQRKWMANDALVDDEWFSQCFNLPSEDVAGPLWVSFVDIPELLRMGLPLLKGLGAEYLPSEIDFKFEDMPPVSILTKEMKPSLSALYRTPQGFQTLQRQTFPGGTPGSLVGATAIGVLPALLKIRNAAVRAQTANQIRQLILAMHNYYDAHRALPARFSKDRDGKPLLSWRVHILPFIEEGDLYREFHLDEPWDSEHNRTLIARMPEVFRHPKLALENGKTVYLAPSGNSVIKSPTDSAEVKKAPTGMQLEEVVDGSSRTAILLEGNAENAVTWTQPDDFSWEGVEDPVSGLFDGWGDGVHVGLVDGSVSFIKFSQLRKVFEDLVQPQDGNIARWDED